MSRKPFPWRKLTPAQIALVARLTTANGALPYGKLDYGELLAFDELRRLKLVDMKAVGRSKLELSLTDEGRGLREAGYVTDRIVVRVTEPQIKCLRFLNDGPPVDSVGARLNDIPSPMIDVCRRMALRGWVDWYEGWNGENWCRLTTEGREVLSAINALDDAIEGAAEAKRQGRLQ